MKVSGKGIVSGLAFEIVPAVIFGSAAAFASAVTFVVSPFGLIPVGAGVSAFAICWLGLRRFGAGPKALPLTDFDQSDLERELALLAEEMQNGDHVTNAPVEDPALDELILEDELPAISEDELLLEEQLLSGQEDSRVIRLFDPRPRTAGEMQEQIEQHLRNTPRPPLSDATQELHEALSALRHSLR